MPGRMLVIINAWQMAKASMGLYVNANPAIIIKLTEACFCS